MTETERDQRQAVITEALTWVGTPFHIAARVKGAGVDCAEFLAAVYEAVGVAKLEAWGFFGTNWWMHTDKEHYRYMVIKHATALPTNTTGQPGDIILVRVEKIFAHGGIVIEWPKVIHAHPSKGVRVDNALMHPALGLQGGIEFFDPWRKPDVR